MTKVKKHNLSHTFWILAFILLFQNIALSQQTQKVDSLLSSIYELDDSKQISAIAAGQKAIGYGYNLLPLLALKFCDTTLTNIKSDCTGGYLTKGDVCIILADQIERMPYAKLTGMQNCTLQFCGPNFIEIYLPSIYKHGIVHFTNDYIEWLKSGERKKWPFYVNR